MRCSSLKPRAEYIFFYPFRSTPCFLLDLGKPTQTRSRLQTESGRNYDWRGGVGPGNSIVAYSAICAHQMTHPSSQVSFIGYRDKAVGFLTKDNQIERRSAVIQCCSEQSIYGPAPQPLAAISLRYADDQLVADGIFGGPMFEQFFPHSATGLPWNMGPTRFRNRS